MPKQQINRHSPWTVPIFMIESKMSKKVHKNDTKYMVEKTFTKFIQNDILARER